MELYCKYSEKCNKPHCVFAKNVYQFGIYFKSAYIREVKKEKL